MQKKRNITKSPIVLEDMARGIGTTTQNRAGTDYTVHLIDVPAAVNSEAELSALDVEQFQFARVHVAVNQAIEYRYDPNSAEGIPSTGLGTWVPIVGNAGTIVRESSEGFPDPAGLVEGTSLLFSDTYKEYVLTPSSTGELMWVEKGNVGDEVDVTAASHLTIARAQASDLRVGQYVVLVDRGYGLFLAVDSTTVTATQFGIIDLGNGIALVVQNKNGMANIEHYGCVATVGDNTLYATQNSAILDEVRDTLLNIHVPPKPMVAGQQPAFELSRPFQLSNEAQKLIGGDRIRSILDASNPVFVGGSCVEVVSGRLQTVSDIMIRGRRTQDGYASDARALSIFDGQNLNIERLTVKNGDYGIWYRGGNSNRWSDVFAESCYTGVRVDPFAASDTNGCVMKGVRAFNCRDWGIDIAEGDAGSVGHMHSRWEMSAEGNNTDGSGALQAGGGIRIRGGLYCKYDLYSEGNELRTAGAGRNFDLPTDVAHEYKIRNPESSEDGALLQSSLAAGYRTQGGVQYFDAGIAPRRVQERSYSTNGNIGGNGISIYVIENTHPSGSAVNLELLMLDYMPVGSFFELWVKPNTNLGFSLQAPAGITLTGTTNNFGNLLNTPERAIIHKISDTECLIQHILGEV